MYSKVGEKRLLHVKFQCYVSCSFIIFHYLCSVPFLFFHVLHTLKSNGGMMSHQLI